MSRLQKHYRAIREDALKNDDLECLNFLCDIFIPNLKGVHISPYNRSSPSGLLNRVHNHLLSRQVKLTTIMTIATTLIFGFFAHFVVSSLK